MNTITKKKAAVIATLVFLVALLATVAIPLRDIPATEAVHVETEAVESLNVMARVISLNLERNWYKTHYFEVAAERDHLKSVEIPALKERKEAVKEKLEQLEKEVGLAKQNNVTTSRGLDRFEQSGAADRQQGSMAYIGTFESTGYNGAEFGSDGKTASGTQVGYGTVAVDPSVISLGTRLYIAGYGEATAEDTGKAIKGKRVDLWMDSVDKCNQWGRKTVKVWKID